MRRFLIPAIPVFIATAALTFGSAAGVSAQEQEHGKAGSASEKCACCRMSGGAMNHGAAQTPAQPEGPAADAADHAAMGHAAPAAPAADAVDHAAMGHGPDGAAPAAKADTKAAAGCAMCAKMGDMGGKMSAKADGHAAGCAMCASMHKPGAAGSASADHSAMNHGDMASCSMHGAGADHSQHGGTSK